MSIFQKFGKNVIAKYENAQSNGIFYELRTIKTPISTKDVEITSQDSYIHGDFCGIGLEGRTAQSLIDGNSKTAWANNESKPSFIINFKHSYFNLQHYSIVSPCNLPRNWILQGSNNKEEWVLLDNRTDIQLTVNKETVYSVFDSKKKLAFQYFNFSLQTSDQKRLHLNSIEFYGILNPINILTCKKDDLHFSSSFLFVIFI